MKMNSVDIKYMKYAYELAAKGRGKTAPNPMVGAVVVKNGKIIADGWHKKYGGPHAEATALKNAGARAKGATLYVTLEPCFHFGRTPPCVDHVIKSGIKEVIIGHRDPNPLTGGKSIKKLKQARVKVKVNVLEKELKRLNEAFMTFMTKGRPFVTAKVAQTLDGKIAVAGGQSKWITSAMTRAYTHRLRDEYDAILVGVNTVIKDNPYLNGKNKAIKKIVLDPALRTPAKANIFKNTETQQCLIAVTKRASVKKIKLLEKRGVKIIVSAEKNGLIDLSCLFKLLAKENLTSILIEGGPRTLGAGLKEKIVDKMQVFMAPKIIGDENALSAVQGLKGRDVNRAVKLDAVTVKKMGEDIMLEGYLRYH